MHIIAKNLSLFHFKFHKSKVRICPQHDLMKNAFAIKLYSSFGSPFKFLNCKAVTVPNDSSLVTYKLFTRLFVCLHKITDWPQRHVTMWLPLHAPEVKPDAIIPPIMMLNPILWDWTENSFFWNLTINISFRLSSLSVNCLVQHLEHLPTLSKLEMKWSLICMTSLLDPLLMTGKLTLSSPGDELSLWQNDASLTEVGITRTSTHTLFVLPSLISHENYAT